MAGLLLIAQNHPIQYWIKKKSPCQRFLTSACSARAWPYPRGKCGLHDVRSWRTKLSVLPCKSYYCSLPCEWRNGTDLMWHLHGAFLGGLVKMKVWFSRSDVEPSLCFPKKLLVMPTISAVHSRSLRNEKNISNFSHCSHKINLVNGLFWLMICKDVPSWAGKHCGPEWEAAGRIASTENRQEVGLGYKSLRPTAWWPTSCSGAPLPEGSITFQNHTFSLEPSVQAYKPMGESSRLNPSKESVTMYLSPQ